VLKPGDWIQICILGVLIVNVIFFWAQYCSTQLLNKPLCAVKQLTIEPALQGKNIINAEKVDPNVKDKNIIKIAAVIKNFGKYQAKKASITWKMVRLKGTKELGFSPTGTTQESTISTELTVLPEQEFEQWLLFIEKKDLDEMIEGWNKAVDINIRIKFYNRNSKPEIYSCTYRITKMLMTKEYLYEVSLIGSRVEN